MIPQPTPLETVTLTSGDSTVYLAPERGGMATRFYVGERPIFYLDEATLLDRSKNVRGGNPILFPSPGKLEGDRWPQGAMAQHGFARTLPWEVVEQTENSAVLRLAATDATREVYPFAFVARFTYRLEGATLRIDQRFEHHGEKPMPFAAGFHPYFYVPQAQKREVRIPTPASRAWDNVKKSEITLAGPIDLGAKEVDVHILDHGTSAASLEMPGGRIDVRASGQFKRWVVWTVEGKDFVCLEPWTSPANALNTGEDLVLARTRDLWTEIAFVSAS